MPYPTDSMTKVRKMIIISLLISAALVLSYFERFIPMNFIAPGIKLGLSNVVTLLGLLIFTPKETAFIVLVRVTLMAFFVGSVTSFFYSFTGGFLSLFAMSITMIVLKDLVSPIGISVIGAFFHNLGQVLVLSIIMGNLSVGMAYFPILVLTGVLSGIFIGWSTRLSYERLYQLKLI